MALYFIQHFLKAKSFVKYAIQDVCINLLRCCTGRIPEIKNIGLLCHKVRRFCLKSTEVYVKEVRCF